MYKTLVPLLCATTALYAAEADPMAEVCARLVTALEHEVEALASIQAAEDVPGALEKLRASLLAQEDLFAVDERLLWLYIDNTAGAKQPIVDVLEELALQFGRMVKSDFFSSEELRQVLAPQVQTTPALDHKRRAKREKLQEIDPDED